MRMMQVGTIGSCRGGNMGWQSYSFLVTLKMVKSVIFDSSVSPMPSLSVHIDDILRKR